MFCIQLGCSACGLCVGCYQINSGILVRNEKLRPQIGKGFGLPGGGAARAFDKALDGAHKGLGGGISGGSGGGWFGGVVHAHCVSIATVGLGL